MASLLAFEPRTTKQVYSAQHFSQHFQDSIQGTSVRKWTYLLSDNIVFSGKVSHAIRLKKPADNSLARWLEKIIVNGQCAQLFVEQLELNDFEQKRINNLCQQYGVLLVNLFTDVPSHKNVVKGPWLG